MSGLARVLAPLAVLQMALPAPAHGSVVMVAACGGTGAPVPLRIPARDDGKGSLPCCKVCHIAMRKRTGADNCCGLDDEDESDCDG